MRKLLLVVCSVVVVLAAFAGSTSAANAASIVLTVDHLDHKYNFGETITLTVTVTTSDTPALLDNNILGRILHTPGPVTPLNNAAQNALTPFANGSLAACTFTDCEVFDQIAFPVAVNPNVTNFVLATVGYTISSGWFGEWDFSWKTTNPGKLDFFGITNAPNVVFTIVPEPTTAALLGFGLFGLALAGRRRA